jgi:hypothetical protein
MIYVVVLTIGVLIGVTITALVLESTTSYDDASMDGDRNATHRFTHELRWEDDNNE